LSSKDKRIELRHIKRRVRDIENDEDVTKIALNDTYHLATWDYTVEEMTEPMSKLGHVPLWDWFNILNVKTKRLWYVDFTCPYVDEYSHTTPIETKISHACISFYYNDDTIKKSFDLKTLGNKDEKYDATVESYKRYNNWDLTFKSFDEKNEVNKNWNEGVSVFKSRDELNSFYFLVPYEYAKSEMSILDAARIGLNAILNGKIKPFNQNKKYKKLMEEIEYDIFLYDKGKSSEMFI
jgi:hypothetical protein